MEYQDKPEKIEATKEEVKPVKRDIVFGPSYEGSVCCESGSIASGGDRAHCSCDICF